MKWFSALTDRGAVALPPFSGIRVLMMPFELSDPAATLPPSLQSWIPVALRILDLSPVRNGVAYLTVDEREVSAGACHRRPGLHVDGWRDDIGNGIWGASNWAGGFGGHGMFMAASHLGSAAWHQSFDGEPATFGDCAHLRSQCCPAARRPIEAGRLYHLGPLTVHESIPANRRHKRQFVRVSLPSDGAWPVSCTPNPLGVQPPRICGVRPRQFTDYVPITIR